MNRIILAGGSGFLGQTLGRHFSRAGLEVVILTRARPSAASFPREVQWDAQTPGPWAAELEGATAVINLAGRSVNCRYNLRNRREIMESRTRSTRVLGGAISRCRRPPRVWLNASTATIYRHTLADPWDETGEIGATPQAKDLFSIEVARAWEAEFERAAAPQTRKVVLRTAMVLGCARNSVLPMLRRLTRLGLGGPMGHGRQYVSWIHEADFCRALEWLIRHDDLAGVFNICAPNPITNAEMMRTLRETTRVPFGLPAARWMLELGALFLHTETELILKSRRVVPRRLLEEGFEFRFPTFREAVLDHETRRTRSFGPG